MIFLVYSPIGASDIQTSLGVADYSYYFVMKKFLPLLKEYGEVRVLDNAPTDDDIADHQKSGFCIYLSFTPPDKLADVSACPMVPVFAWEYSTLPNESFSRPDDNWANRLQSVACAITHSIYAQEVVKAGTASGVEVSSIPAPVWDSLQLTRDKRRRSRPMGLTALTLDCKVIDTDDFLISNTAIRPKPSLGDHKKNRLVGSWDDQALNFDLSQPQTALTLIGFNEPENWGVWSRSGYPWIMFDCALEGEFELTITLRGYIQNIGSTVRLEIGAASADALLSERLSRHVFRLNLTDACNVLTFLGLEKRAVGGEDPRDIALGIGELHLRRVAVEEETESHQVIDLSQKNVVAGGFHPPENAGRWSAQSDCYIQLKKAVSGDIQLSIELFHMLHNDGETIEIFLGTSVEKITLVKGVQDYDIRFQCVCQTDYVKINGLKGGPGSEQDSRSLGIGISSISLRTVPQHSHGVSFRASLDFVKQSIAQGVTALSLSGRTHKRNSVLYTAILNPKDGRKNWEDILTAFVYAFRNDSLVTLLIKITYHDLEELYADIFTMLCELHPFECRIVFIHGYLSDDVYENLILHSHYVVNASRGEGQCLPLMEFMSAGVPAIAPDNTAMAEYVHCDNSFVVDSSPELTFWPQDPRQVFRTFWYRINWESLVTAYSESAHVFRARKKKYRAFSEAATRSLQSYCSLSVARSGLDSILSKLAPDHES